ncbi:MAG: DUF1631 family protein [Pseudomonadota bacterium]
MCAHGRAGGAYQALDDLKKKYLLMHCQRIMAQRITAWFSTVLDAYRETLGKELTHTRSGSSKMLYLDAMRDLAAKREALEQSFSLQLFKHYYRGLKPEGWYRLGEKAGAVAACRGDWDEELEAQLTDELIEKADEQYERLLANLLSQYRLLIGTHLTPETLPVSPRNVCQTFNYVMAGLRADIDIKQQAYQCFEHLLLDAMALVYLEIYEYLAREGVLAQTSHVAPPTCPAKDDPVNRDRALAEERLLAGVRAGVPVRWREAQAERKARLLWKSADGAVFLFALDEDGRVICVSRSALLGQLRDQ